MRIGSVKLDSLVIAAPLAGVTHLPFRLLARECGAGLVCSEMVSAAGLSHKSAKTRDLMATCTAEKPLSIQIFGADPDIMAEAAVMAEAAGADIIDINFGCSVKKILKSGSGAALMRDMPHAQKLIRSVRQAIRIPLTIKMRSGWDASGEQAMALAQVAADCGVDAIAVHPRTARQGFRGRADWSLIARIKAVVDIPVIGNGDITAPEDAVRMMNETGCDGVMVGRAAIAHPMLFSQINSLITTGRYETVDLEKRFDLMKRFLCASVDHIGESNACRMMRSRLGWLSKGLPHAGRFRTGITQIRTRAEAEEKIDAYLALLIDERQKEGLKEI